MSDPKIIAELHRIAEDHGGELKPADIVAEARPEASPLHSQFQWDDTVAARQYRLWQARQLIRVTVEYVGSQDRGATTRVFVSLTPDRENEGGGYRSVSAVMANPKYRAQLLADALKDMERFQKKYEELQELAEIFAAIRKVRRKDAA